MLAKHDATCLAYALTVLTTDLIGVVVQSSHDAYAVFVYDTLQPEPCAQLDTLAQAVTYIRAAIAAAVIHEGGA